MALQFRRFDGTHACLIETRADLLKLAERERRAGRFTMVLTGVLCGLKFKGFITAWSVLNLWREPDTTRS